MDNTLSNVLVVYKLEFDAKIRGTQRPYWSSQKSDFSEK